MAWRVRESFGVQWRSAARNHSRDRHGSIFDGAEWVGSRSCVAWRVNFASVLSRSVMARCVLVRSGSAKNLSHGRHGAHSMARRGICFGLLRLGWASQYRFPSGWFCEPLLWSAHVRLRGRGAGSIMASHGNVWSGKLRSVEAGCVRSRKPPTRSAWSRLRCCKVGYAPASLGGARRSAVVFGESWKPPSCWHGGRSTRPWWDELWCGSACRFAVGQCGSGFVRPSHGRVGLSTKLVQARGRINAGGLGCTKEWCGGLMLGMVRIVEFWQGFLYGR